MAPSSASPSVAAAVGASYHPTLRRSPTAMLSSAVSAVDVAYGTHAGTAPIHAGLSTAPPHVDPVVAALACATPLQQSDYHAQLALARAQMDAAASSASGSGGGALTAQRLRKRLSSRFSQSSGAFFSSSDGISSSGLLIGSAGRRRMLRPGLTIATGPSTRLQDNNDAHDGIVGALGNVSSAAGTTPITSTTSERFVTPAGPDGEGRQLPVHDAGSGYAAAQAGIGDHSVSGTPASSAVGIAFRTPHSGVGTPATSVTAALANPLGAPDNPVSHSAASSSSSSSGLCTTSRSSRRLFRFSSGGSALGLATVTPAAGAGNAAPAAFPSGSGYAEAASTSAGFHAANVPPRTGKSHSSAASITASGFPGSPAGLASSVSLTAGAAACNAAPAPRGPSPLAAHPAPPPQYTAAAALSAWDGLGGHSARPSQTSTVVTAAGEWLPSTGTATTGTSTYGRSSGGHVSAYSAHSGYSSSNSSSSGPLLGGGGGGYGRSAAAADPSLVNTGAGNSTGPLWLHEAAAAAAAAAAQFGGGGSYAASADGYRQLSPCSAGYQSAAQSAPGSSGGDALAYGSARDSYPPPLPPGSPVSQQQAQPAALAAPAPLSPGVVRRRGSLGLRLTAAAERFFLRTCPCLLGPPLPPLPPPPPVPRQQ